MSKNLSGNAWDKLDVKVITIVLLMAIFEFEIMTHARSLVDIAKQDAIFSILLGGLLLILVTFLLVKLAIRFPDENLFQYSKKVWGKPIALIIALAYLFYFFIFMVLLFQDFTNADRTLFLPRTPVLIPMILMGFGAVWLAAYGIAAIVRFLLLVFPLFAVLMISLAILSLREVRLENLLPLFSNGFMPIIKGAIMYVGVIQGVEVLLFISPFLRRIDQSLKPALFGVVPVILFMLVSSINAIGILGVENVLEFAYPGIAILSIVEISGFTVERYELFLTLPWLIAIFTTMCIYIYLLSYGIIEVFGLPNRKITIYLVTTAIIGMTYLIPNLAWTMVLRGYFNYFTLIFVAFIPICTLVLAMIRGKEGTNNA
ncbi:MAG: endospore germination permease [Bacillota bacterium]|nr:endospore germination permease [Bacillota bacterium]